MGTRMAGDARDTIDPAIAARIAALEATIAAQQVALDEEHAARVEAEAERDRLREAYQELLYQAQLAQHRLTVAKAERVDTTQLELEFADTLAELDRLAGLLADESKKDDKSASSDSPPAGAPRKRGGSGRRQLRKLIIGERRIEMPDPSKEGKHARIGFEESSRLMHQRGGTVRVIKARVKYADEQDRTRHGTTTAPDETSSASLPTETTDAHDSDAVSGTSSKVDDVSSKTDEPKTFILPLPPEISAAATAQLKPGSIYTTPLPPELLPRAIVGPSMIAHIAVDKFCDGIPLYRQEDRFARIGAPIDRGSMCRWLEEVGNILGATVVEAMREEALATAFCIATDATGVLVQPLREAGKQKRQPCRRAHFFVQIADADHVFFEYTAKETSAVVGELFRGFSGYVQADAKSVYDFLYRRANERSPSDDTLDDGATRVEVGCWSHLRTKLWEAAITTKDAAAREGLARIMRMFQLERAWKKMPAAERNTLRDLHLRTHVEKFFEFARAEYERVNDQRGLVRTAFGYAVRQEHALVRFLDDARLEMTNNRSERQLRRVATGRKAWLFVGSDDHGEAAGSFFTMIASARLHGLDPEEYLRDVFILLPQWPKDRYLELAPKYWRATRARLEDQAQLFELEMGWLKVPEPSLLTDLARKRAELADPQKPSAASAP